MMAFTLEPGSVIAARYRLVAWLGAGGMGVVWSAEHVVTGRLVAIKFLRDGGLDTKARRRCVSEARAACAVRHPCIVPVHDVLEADDGEPALVMDLLEGESLAALLAREGRLAVEEAARLLAPVASALAAAHAAGVVHRDLKPDNVFLTTDGGVRVLDFGIAKRLEADTGRRTTATGLKLKGTPLYMSPEQAASRPDLDHRTDVWSLGLVLYECLTGTVPTAAPSVGEVLAIIIGGTLRPLRDVAPALPGPVCELVDAMLAREPARRPGDMGEVAAALARMVGIEARGDALAAAVPAGPRPSPRKEGAAAEALADTVAAERAPASPRPPARAERWRRGWFAVVAGLALIGAVATVVWLAARHRGDAADDAPARISTTSGEGVATGLRLVDVTIDAEPETQAELAHAMRVLRSGGDFVRAFDALVGRHPDCAPCLLRAAVIEAGMAAGLNDRSRARFRRALEARGRLSPRDQALLDALALMMLPQPADLVGASQKLGEALARFPDDPELLLWRGFLAPDLQAGAADFERMLVIDPGCSIARLQIGQLQQYRGEFDAAAATFERCLALDPEAVWCGVFHAYQLAPQGACKEVEDIGRRIIRTDPSSPQGYALVLAGVAADATPATLAQILELRDAHVPEAQRTGAYLPAEVARAALRGDFGGAAAAAQAWLGRVDGHASVEDQGFAIRALAETVAEGGDRRRTAAAAREMLARIHTLDPVARSDDTSWLSDPLPTVLGIGVASGAVAVDEALGEMRVWRAPGGAPPETVAAEPWLLGWTRLAAWSDSPELAEAVLGRAPDVSSWGRHFAPGDRAVAATLGRTLQLAGRAAKAIPWLERAVRSCSAFADPVLHARAHVWLVEARAPTGDSQACTPLAALLARFAHEPPGVTATSAQALARTLGCTGAAFGPTPGR